MKPKLIIFDFDGTLADTYSLFLKAANEASQVFKFRQITEADIEPIRHLDTKEILKSLKIRWWKLPKLALFMRSRMSQGLSEIRLFHGVRELIQELSVKGYTLGVVSSNSFENVEKVLTPELSKLISHFACGSSLFGKKAHFKEMMKLAGVNSQDTMCIGDETRDVESAKEVGCISVAVTWGYSHPEALAKRKPDHIFHSVQDLRSYLA